MWSILVFPSLWYIFIYVLLIIANSGTFNGPHFFTPPFSTFRVCSGRGFGRVETPKTLFEKNLEWNGWFWTGLERIRFKLRSILQHPDHWVGEDCTGLALLSSSALLSPLPLSSFKNIPLLPSPTTLFTAIIVTISPECLVLQSREKPKIIYFTLKHKITCMTFIIMWMR